MTYQIERRLVETRFKTMFAASQPTVPMDFENAEFEQPSDQPWVRLAIISGPSFPASLGHVPNVRYRHTGSVMVQIFAPAGTGSHTARGIADSVAAIFRGITLQDSGQQFVFEAPEILQGLTDAGWFQLTVAIPFQRDEFF